MLTRRNDTEALSRLVDADDDVQQVAGGFNFTEGPVWNHAGAFLLFSDMRDDVRRRWSPRLGVEPVMSPSNKCNGMVYDRDHNLLVCEHATSMVVREYADGARETIASHYGDKELNSPNDIVTRSDGTVYFTDPIYGRRPPSGVAREQELSFQGVFRITLAGGVELAVAEDDFEQPNGLCFSPDESLLYINDDQRALIRVYDVAPDGSLSNGRVFFDNIWNGVSLEDGEPDGMKCDAEGNLWVAACGGVWIISPHGDYVGSLPVPELTTNLAWGGDDWRTLFITASTSVYSVRTSVGPATLPYRH